MRRKTILVVTVAQLINYGLPIVTFTLLVKAFDIASYGIWIEISTIVGLITIFGTLGLGNALGALAVNYTGDTHIIYANSLYAFIGLSGVLSIAMYFAAPLLNLLTTRSPEAVDIFRIASLLILVGALNLLASQVYRLRGKATTGATFDILISFARLGATIFAYFTHDLLAFATVFVISQLLFTITQVVIAFLGIRLTKPSWLEMRRLASYGLNLSIVSQASWLVMYGDRLMLSILSISAAVAVYSASYQLSQILVALGWPYLYMLLPALGNYWKAQDIPGMELAVRRSIRSILITVIPGVMGLTLIGNALLVVLANSEFSQGGLLVGMIALGVSIDIIGTNLQYLFYVKGKPEVLRNIYIRAAAFNILINLVAIPLFSYNGAGLTTLLTFVYIFYSLWRRTEIPFLKLFDMGVFWRCLLVSAVMGVWVIFTVAPTITGLTVAITGGAVIYGVGILLLRVISMEEVLAIPRAIIRRFAPQA